MSETQENKTNRRMLTEVLQAVHPDADLNDDEVLFGIICDDYSEYADMIHRQTDHDDEVARARAEGEVAGRNARIDELVTEVRDGDGMPRLGGAIMPAVGTAPTSIFDLALGRGA